MSLTEPIDATDNARVCDGAGDRPQDFGRLHGGRRATGEQSGDLVRADPPRFAVREQIAHWHEIAAVRCQVPARRLLEVRKRARRMLSELGIVEFREFDGLQCEVPRHLDRPVPVEPAIHLLAPPAFLPCERGGLGSPAKLRVQPHHHLHDEYGRQGFRRGARTLPDPEWSHVQAAVHELRLHTGERQAVALHELDGPFLERPLVGVANDGREGPQTVMSGFELPLARCGWFERKGRGPGGVDQVVSPPRAADPTHDRTLPSIQ